MPCVAGFGGGAGVGGFGGGAGVGGFGGGAGVAAFRAVGERRFQSPGCTNTSRGVNVVAEVVAWAKVPWWWTRAAGVSFLFVYFFGVLAGWNYM